MYIFTPFLSVKSVLYTSICKYRASMKIHIQVNATLYSRIQYINLHSQCCKHKTSLIKYSNYCLLSGQQCNILYNPISNVILHTQSCSIELVNILYSEFYGGE